MPRSLAQALVQAGVVSEAALNEALQRQVVFGGSLDTNLLEIGAAKESALLAGLGEAFDLPTAGKDAIDEVGAHIPRIFPLVFAETYHLVPFRLVEQELSVLSSSEPDAQLFGRIRERLRLEPKPVATTEVRLHYAMHRLYGTALLPRFANLLKRLDGELPTTSAGAQHVLSWGLSSAVITPAPTPARGGETRRRLDVRGLLTRLDAANDRDSIVELLLGAVLAVFDFAGLFAVHGDVVNGWRGATPEVTERLARVSLNVELPSVFQTIYATGGHYLGPLPQNSINQKLLADIGRSAPRAALLAPILVSGRLAAILYADNGAVGVASKRVAAVLLLAQRAGMAFERLIRRRKTRADAAVADAVEVAEPLEAGPILISAEGEAWVVQEAAPAARAAKAEAEADAKAEAQGEAKGEGKAEGTQEPSLEIELPAAESPPASSPPETPRASAAPERWGTVRLSEVEGTEIDVIVEDEIILEPEEGAFAGETAPPTSAPGDAGYEAFSDISQSPDAALDDWEDVLVETAGLEGAAARAVMRPGKPAPPSVTWDDVIAEAERAQSTAPSRSVEVAGTVVEARELLFDSLEAQSPEARRGAVDKLLALGSAIDDELRERFPGRLAFDPLAPNAGLPAFRASSGLCELVAARGVSAAPVVLPHLESPDPIRRLFAIYFLHTVACPAALGALARRLYDTEPKNRFLAAEALRGYAREPGYSHVVQSLRDQLKVPVLESQVSAVQILGQLREPSAVPSLIPLVVAKRSELAGAAASALAVICGQAFGNDVAHWAEWWQAHYNRPRPAWLLESLRHPSAPMARLAHNELALLSGREVHFEEKGTPAARDAAVHEWESWWLQAARSYPTRG